MSQSWQPKGRILIGETLRTLACSMQQALERSGYAVELAADGEQALRMVRAAPPDLVVLDVSMPRLHGDAVLRALRGDPALSKIGVLLCTAPDAPADGSEELGIEGILAKPFEPPVLVEKVEAFFSRRDRAARALGLSDAPTGEPFRQTLQDALGRYTLWGTRGSTPVPGGRFLRHGGNTSCMSIESGGATFILDAGTGIRELGLELVKEDCRKLTLFITHTHWDHIQGFPFFTPAYVPDFDLTIYGAQGFGKDLESVFKGQLERDYFPVQMEDMNSQIHFLTLPEQALVIGGVKVSWEFAQHPGPTVGYKVEVAGRRIAWVPDNEFLLGYTGPPELIDREHPRAAPYAKMIDFLSDADLVIHEAQYTTEEYPGKVRWGHSSIANAAVLMKLAGVRRWLITHHDPMHDDAFLETKLNLTRRILDRIGHPIQVSHAYDGLTEYF